MKPRSCSRSRSSQRGDLFVLLAAVLCVVGVTLVPDWERRLHAQSYGGIPGDVDRSASEQDRKVIEEQLKPTYGKLSLRRGFFLTLHRDTLDIHDDRGPEQSFRKVDSRQPGFLAGFDYQYTEDLLLGWSVGFDDAHADIDQAGTKIQTTNTYTYRFGPYARYQGAEPWYVYSILLADVLDLRNRRHGVEGLVKSDTSGAQLDASVGGGYDFNLARLRFGPIASVEYRGVWVSGYTEKGDFVDRLKVDGLTLQEIELRFGGEATYSIPLQSWMIVPDIRLVGGYEDFFDDGPSTFSTVGCVDSSCRQRAPVITPGRFLMELGAGLGFVLPDHWICSVNYHDTFFQDRTDQSGVSISLRKQF